MVRAAEDATHTFKTDTAGNAPEDGTTLVEIPVGSVGTQNARALAKENTKELAAINASLLSTESINEIAKKRRSSMKRRQRETVDDDWDQVAKVERSPLAQRKIAVGLIAIVVVIVAILGVLGIVANSGTPTPTVVLGTATNTLPPARASASALAQTKVAAAAASAQATVTLTTTNTATVAPSATTTPTSISTADPAQPTVDQVASANGTQVRLIYQRDQIDLINISGRMINLAPLVFIQRGATERRFEARVWNDSQGALNSPERMPDGRCFQISRIEVGNPKVAGDCTRVSAYRVVSSPRQFWIAQNDGTVEFEVWWSDTEKLASCAISSGQCEIKLPASALVE
jgi:hypothetical protein